MVQEVRQRRGGGAKELLEMQKEMARDISINQEMVMTEQDRRDHTSATCCYLCRGGFKKVPKTNKRTKVKYEGTNKVRDHDHANGQYRGAVCNKSNLQHHLNEELVVVVHNLKGYDSHVFIREALKIAKDLEINTISAIPVSNEKFISFSIG